MRQNKGEKFAKGLATGVILAVITIFVMLTALVWYFITGGPAKQSDKIKDYQEIFELYLHSGLIVFPEEIPGNVAESEFYYHYRHSLFDPTYQIYLRCTYDEEDWEREYERLESICKLYDNQDEKLKRGDEENYHYPAYIAKENFDYGYEYALLTGENEITYVCTNFVDRRNIRFNREYLPENYMNSEEVSGMDGYSIYVVSASGGSYYIEYDRELYVPDIEK